MRSSNARGASERERARVATALKYRLVYKSSILDRGSITSRGYFRRATETGLGGKSPHRFGHRLIAIALLATVRERVCPYAMPATYSYRVATGRVDRSENVETQLAGRKPRTAPRRSTSRSYKAAIYDRHRGREELRTYVGQTALRRRFYARCLRADKSRSMKGSVDPGTLRGAAALPTAGASNRRSDIAVSQMLFLPIVNSFVLE